MKTAKLLTAVIHACVILIAANCVLAQDWPQWRGPSRDGKVEGFETPQRWALKQVWKTKVGEGDATPALVDGVLYAFTRQGDDEVITALEAASGEELWSVKYAAKAVTGAASRHPGPRSSPAVANGKIVTLGVAGVVSCLNTDEGKLVWRKNPYPDSVPRFFTSFSPIIVDRMAIVHLGGQGNGAVIAYDLNSGDEKWRWDGEGPDYGSPVLATVEGTGMIVSPTEKSIVGISVADGKLLWKYPFPPARRAYNAATPIVDNQTVYITGIGRGTRALKIEKQGDGFAVKELWSNPDIATQYNTPVLKDGLLFGISNSNHFFCIDAQTGKTAWVDETQRGRGGFGSVVSAGSCLIALTSEAELIIYKPSEEGFSGLFGSDSEVKVSDTPIYAHPVISGDRIFIKDQNTVSLMTIRD